MLSLDEAVILDNTERSTGQKQSRHKPGSKQFDVYSILCFIMNYGSMNFAHLFFLYLLHFIYHLLEIEVVKIGINCLFCFQIYAKHNWRISVFAPDLYISNICTANFSSKLCSILSSFHWVCFNSLKWMQSYFLSSYLLRQSVFALSLNSVLFSHQLVWCAECI